MPRLCEQKTVGETTYFRLDAEKLRLWLLSKVGSMQYQTLANDIGTAVPAFSGEELTPQSKVSAICILQDLLPASLFSSLLEWTSVSQDIIDSICCPLKRAADPLPAGPVTKQAKPQKSSKTAPVPKDMKSITDFFKSKS